MDGGRDERGKTRGRERMNIFSRMHLQPLKQYVIFQRILYSLFPFLTSDNTMSCSGTQNRCREPGSLQGKGEDPLVNSD